MKIDTAHAVNMPESPCPTCGHVNRAAAPSHPVDYGKKIKPGDIGLCAKCGELLELDQDLHLTYATLDNVMKLSPKFHGEITRFQAQIRRERPMG